MHKWLAKSEYERLREFMALHGHDLIQGLLILVIGLILLHWFIRRFRTYIDRHKGNQWPVKRISSIVYILLLVVVLNISLVRIGLDFDTIARFLAILGLAAIALVIVLRPWLPTLPFHVGNVVLIDGLFGKVAGTNIYHTRIKTFDGKVVFIPNSKIMKTVVTNYHETSGRRIKINVRIPYDQDLIRAKQLLEELMISDPRVLTTPRPQVWTLDLKDGAIGVGARCWTDNQDFWLTKCELTEMIKLRFDHENIRMALPMQQVYLQHQLRPKNVSGDQLDSIMIEEGASGDQ